MYELRDDIKWIFMFLALTLCVGCASGTKRGVVAMKISDTEAHVGIGADEVKSGDHVELYRNVCTGNSGKYEGTPRTCRKDGVGHGIVTQVLNQDYSVVQFEPGTQFSEGDTVEKHAH